MYKRQVLHCAWQCWEFCYQYYFEGDLEKCLALADVTLAASTEHGIGFFKCNALTSFVYAHLSVGQLEAGRAALARFRPVLHAFRPLERGHYASLRAWEAWLSGRLSEALDILERALPVSYTHLDVYKRQIYSNY